MVWAQYEIYTDYIMTQEYYLSGLNFSGSG